MHESTSSPEVVARHNLLGNSAAFRGMIEQIARLAKRDFTILLQGETGTGKELAARAIHYLSQRREGPFIPINCGATPDSLICSELFGHARGAFTDARECHQGLIAQANKGTLFLDEVETMSAACQVALLRFLQDHEYRPVGSVAACRANVRVIAATNADLAELALHGRFRHDLLYRLNGLCVELPPLRERADDVILLARTFLHRLSIRYGESPKILHPDGIAALRSHSWPGNVRELENVVQREFLMSDDGELRFECLRSPASTPPVDALPRGLTDVAFREAKARAIAAFERAYISELLTRARGNVSLAARLAGKERSRLGRLVRKYSLSTTAFKGNDATRPT